MRSHFSVFSPFANGSSVIPMLILMTTLTIWTLSCTTKAPEDPNSAIPSSKGQNKDNLAEWTIQDQQSIKDSIFVQLSQDASEVEAWEQSDAWIQYYQGQLKKSLVSFDIELKTEKTAQKQRLLVGQARARLELSTSYAHLAEINDFLTPLWLEYERGRPNSELHQPWYTLIEWLNLHRAESSRLDTAERPEILPQKMDQNEEVNALLKWLDGDNTKPPTTVKVRRSFKKWHQFYLAVKSRQLDKAQTLYEKLKADAHILTAKGKNGIPSLKVYDPRAPKVLSQYYALLVSQNCENMIFGAYYCGRSYELLNQPLKAHVAYTKAMRQLNDLIADPLLKTQGFAHHLLLTSHLSFDSFIFELKARIRTLAKNKEQTSSQTLARQSATLEKKSASTVEELWNMYGLSTDQQIPSLFPERRRILSALMAKALDNAKGKYIDYIASLSLSDRWLDELHYLYAIELVRRDQRVPALKTLNAAEEAKAGARLQGRNRLPRLFLSVFNQLKMGRYRVGAKYLQRLKKELPALSLSLMMTSDILSGKSFEQNGSRANAGQ